MYKIGEAHCNLKRVEHIKKHRQQLYDNGYFDIIITFESGTTLVEKNVKQKHYDTLVKDIDREKYGSTFSSVPEPY